MARPRGCTSPLAAHVRGSRPPSPHPSPGVCETRRSRGIPGRARATAGWLLLLPPETQWSASMRIAVVGAGPAGLCFSLLLKRRWPKDEIVVIEQNPRDATFGFGVVFSRGALESLAPLTAFDLVVGADGVNSFVRRALAPVFEPRIEWLRNKFAWYGTPQLFECLTLTFRQNDDGVFVAHHYRYSPTMSTFVVECDAATWRRAGLDRMDEAQSRAYCERLFGPDLEGKPLLSNKSVWRSFP